MERLTKNMPAANFKAVPVNIALDFAFELDDTTWLGLQAIFDRLSEYEDIGLSPEEIKALATIDGGLAMNTDECAHKAFVSLPYRRPAPAYCRRCGSTLKVAYHEQRLYSVACPDCATVTLVKAGNPAQAARIVGEPMPQMEGPA